MGQRHKKRCELNPVAIDTGALWDEPRPVVIIGAGTFLSDLVDLLKENPDFKITGILDPNPGLRGQFVNGLPILGWLGDIPRHVNNAVIGNPATPDAFDRESVYRLLARQDIHLPILVASSSRYPQDLTLRRGSLLLHGCTIEPGASLGENCLIAAQAVVEGYSTVPNHYTVAPNTRFTRQTREEKNISPPHTLPATLVSPRDTIQEIMRRLNTAAMEIVLVVNEKGALVGTITDGDVRRGMLAGIDADQPVSLIMSRNPVTVPLGSSHADMLNIMREKSIRHLPVVDNEQRPVRLERMEFIVDDLTAGGQGAIVMAGGQGQRLRPLTENMPKPLLPVAGRPILDRILDGLRDSGIEDVVLSLNYLGDRIREHIGDGTAHELNVAYVAEQQRLGTAGALSLLRPRPKKPFLVMNGDLLTGVHFDKLLQFQRDHNHTLVMCVRRQQTQIQYGVVDIRDGCVVGVREKPTVEHFINAGIYVLKPSCIDLIPQTRYFDMTDLVDAVLTHGGTVGAFPIYEYWRDIGRPEDLRAATQEHMDVRREPGTAQSKTAGIPMEVLP